MTNLNRSPKLRLQAALFDLIEYCEKEDDWGINEVWMELDQQSQEQIWSFLSSQQKVTIRTALSQGKEETIF